MRRALLVLLLTLAGLAGCGPTVGDPCTTSNDCGGKLCLNNRDYVPGGYCTQPCTLGDERTCPAGTLCVRDALSDDSPGCMRTCRTPGECRLGYACIVTQDSALPVCVGPDGI